MKFEPSPDGLGRWLLNGVELAPGDKIVVNYFNLWHLAEVQFDEERNIYILVVPWGTMAIDGQMAYRT